MTGLSRARFAAAILLIQAVILFSPHHIKAQTSSAALTGSVSSQEEGPMEGVLVSAKKAGSTIRVTVASDQQGRYSFPRNRLEPGEYSLSIRAAGFEIEPTTVTLTAQKTATADLRLRKAKDLSAQLSNTEWLLSMPPDEQKSNYRVIECTMCHTYQRIVRSKHNSDEFTRVMQRMATYYIGASPLVPQFVPAFKREPGDPERFRKMADFWSSVNLSNTPTWKYSLKTLPRPTGKSTRMIVTEYDLPRKESQPHDVIVASDGMIWYMDFGGLFVGKLDPNTGQVTEYQVPLLKPDQPRGGLEISEDKDGNIWVALQFQAGLAKFDKKTQKFQMFPLPKELDNDRAQTSMMVASSSHVDGKVWVKANGVGGSIQRLDIATGKYESAKPSDHGAYGISVDTHNNVYFMELGSEYIGRVDAKTLETKVYRTPTPHSGPRRGHADAQDRLWFGEFAANKIGMFDPRTEQIQEWSVPTPWTNPYDAVADKNGEVWAGGMTSDRVIRLNPKTGQITEYQLPEETNIRRVFVDDAKTPVTFWVGNDHHASIIKLEPQD